MFHGLFKKADIGYDRFIRTSELVHKRAVKSIWNQLKDKGYIKYGEHKGYYSVNDESFVNKRDLYKTEIDGKDHYYTVNGEPV